MYARIVNIIILSPIRMYICGGRCVGKRDKKARLGGEYKKKEAVCCGRNQAVNNKSVWFTVRIYIIHTYRGQGFSENVCALKSRARKSIKIDRFFYYYIIYTYNIEGKWEILVLKYLLAYIGRYNTYMYYM